MLKAGYTLLELVMVILLVGILASAAVPLIITPINSYQSNQARLTLTLQSDRLNTFISQQLASAIPNTMLVSNDLVQWLHTDAVYQYASPGQQPACDALVGNDLSFALLGQLANIAQPPALIVRPLNGEAVRQDWLSTANSGAVLRDYQVADDPGCADDPSANNNNLIELTNRHRFNPPTSQLHRLYTATGWRALSCVDNTLVFTELTDPITHNGELPAAPHTLVAPLAACNLSLIPGTPNHAPQLRLSITLTSATEQQPLELLYELYNAP